MSTACGISRYLARSWQTKNRWNHFIDSHYQQIMYVLARKWHHAGLVLIKRSSDDTTWKCKKCLNLHGHPLYGTGAAPAAATCLVLFVDATQTDLWHLFVNQDVIRWYTLTLADKRWSLLSWVCNVKTMKDTENSQFHTRYNCCPVSHYSVLARIIYLPASVDWLILAINVWPDAKRSD